MQDQDVLRVQNTQEALRQIQRYTSVAVGAALALVLLEYASTSESVSVVGIPVPLEPSVAIVLLVSAYVVCGFLLYGSILQAKELAGRIRDPEIRELAFSLPTFATSGDAGIKWPANLLAPGLFAIYVVLRLFHDTERGFEEYFFLLVVGLAPYGGLVYQLRKPLA